MDAHVTKRPQPKAVAKEYAPSPFFFAQTNQDGAVRIVAWAASLVTMRTAFERLIRALPASLEVLLKVRPDPADAPSGEETTWERYHGVVAQGALLEAMDRCDAFVYQDSGNQLCVRDPSSFDYVVLDDVGVIYVYSDELVFQAVLAELGFEDRIEELVSERPHWGHTPKDAPEQGREFIRLLRLSRVQGPGESRDPRSLQ
jgi:hypothetical protein